MNDVDLDVEIIDNIDLFDGLFEEHDDKFCKRFIRINIHSNEKDLKEH